MIYPLLQRFDADEVAPGLYVGSAPISGPTVARQGFDTLVLMAKDYQPSGEDFPGVEVIGWPLDDDGAPSDAERKAARAMGKAVADRIRQNKRVLVTCIMGINRSAWVVGHALIALGMTPKDAIARIRDRRHGTLGNPHFAQDLLLETGRLR